MFLLKGEGLGASVYMKIIPSSESCGGVLGGADENRSAVDGGGAVQTRNPKPEIRNSKPETRDPIPKARNLRSEASNPKHETRNTKHEK